MSHNQFEQLLHRAIEKRASDVYLQPFEEHYQLSYRLAAGLLPVSQLSAEQAQSFLTYFKFHAGMTISETRRPQLGAMTIEIAQMAVRLRLSSVGDFLGRESLVIRLIYPFVQKQIQYLVPEQFEQLKTIGQSRGLILFSGPTGSGKTTTMYHLARELGTGQSVLAIEDPTEIVVPEFLQLQVNEEAGMTYEALLKVGLRHRPDTFIIGEIRDALTAQHAIRAALSGHLLLSTIHARNVGGVYSRLIQLRVDPAHIMSALTAVAYQRLLPTTKTSAVLFDLVMAGPHHWQLANEMTKDWGRLLEANVKQGIITEATARQYTAG